MATFTDPFNEDIELDEKAQSELDSSLDEINKLETPEQIAEYKAKLNESLPKSTTEEVEGNLVKLTIEDTKVPEPEISKPIEPTPAPIVEPVTTGQPQDKLALTISDELISSFPEADRKFFDNFKGKPLEEVLKSYVNAQRLIGKKAENILSSLQPSVVGQQQPFSPPAVTTQQEFKIPETQPIAIPPEDGYAKTKEDFVTSQLRLKYPDFPTEADEIKAYKANLNYENPDSYYELRQYELNVRTAVEDDYKKIDYVRNNHSTLNVDLINQEVETINKYMKEKFNVELSKLGMDLTLDANNDNEFIRDLLFVNGQTDPSLLNDLYGIKLIKPNALVTKFIDKNLTKILAFRDQESRTAGFEAANSKRPLTTLGGNPLAGEQIKEIASLDDIAKMSDIDQVRLQKARLEAKII